MFSSKLPFDDILINVCFQLHFWKTLICSHGTLECKYTKRLHGLPSVELRREYIIDTECTVSALLLWSAAEEMLADSG